MCFQFCEISIGWSSGPLRACSRQWYNWDQRQFTISELMIMCFWNGRIFSKYQVNQNRRRASNCLAVKVKILWAPSKFLKINDFGIFVNLAKSEGEFCAKLKLSGYFNFCERRATHSQVTWKICWTCPPTSSGIMWKICKLGALFLFGWEVVFYSCICRRQLNVMNVNTNALQREC